MAAVEPPAPVCASCQAALCPRCNDPLPPARPTGRRRRWCSDRCRWAASRAKARARPRPGLAPEELAALLAAQTWRPGG